MNYPYISILIPIHNGIEFLDECVQSILKQSYKNYEIIIGVNGFNENSSTYIKAQEYSSKINNNNTLKITVLDLYHIKGKSNALNEMIKHTSYDWISLLDVDDLWHIHKLDCQIKYTYYYDVIGTLCIYFGDMNISPKLPVGDLKDFNFLEYNPIINSSCLIKKEFAIWEENGIEDYDLWLKLWKQGKSFYNVGHKLTYHRIHNDSAFNSKGNNLLVKSLKDKYK
jgi:glycosyltransferase involved in cell wall biosynthesis